MNENDVSRDVNSVGAICFVQYLGLWVAVRDGQISGRVAAERLMRAEAEVNSLNAAQTKVSVGKKLVSDLGRLKKALSLISEKNLEKEGRPEIPPMAATLAAGCLTM